MSETITIGTRLLATDAEGKKHRVIAASGVERGHKFPIVWVTFLSHDYSDEPVPWPAGSVALLSAADRAEAGE